MLGTVETILTIIVSLITILSALGIFFGWTFGFFALLKRFGRVSSREISIVADGDSCGSLRRDLTDTGIILARNVKPIDRDHLSDIRESKLLLVDYRYVTNDELKYIVDNKQTNCGLIVYAPPVTPLRRLPDDVMEKIVNHPYTLVVNFRGRLVNDVLTAMMTTPR